MPSLRRPSLRVACAVSAALFICALGSQLISRSTAARAANVGQLQQQISAGQGQVSSLAGAVGAASSQLAQLDASIASLQIRIARIQADLDAKRAELLKLRTDLIAARTRLAQLQAFEAHAERVLSAQLVNSYESDSPDLMTVVLESTGFQDLLERISFAQRIRKQDVQVVSEVRTARRAVAAQAIRLGSLEARQQTLTSDVLDQRNSVAGVRLNLIHQQIAVARVRDQRAGQLASARAHVAGLQSRLSKLEAAQAAAAAVAARAAAATQASQSYSSSSGSSGSSSASAGSGPVSSGGGFTFPLPKASASPPSTWSPDLGVDISAPGDTPEYAVCSGTIVLHGIGGFGQWAPVLHCDSAVGGHSYVYYGHAGPANQLAVGTHVEAGQAMSSIGPGIVGISTGPHIEIGFCDSSGSPLGTQTAGTMLSLLQGAYGG